MTATRQVYTLDASWDNVALAGVWRTMLIDAGLMTEWYDSWSDAVNVIEHRVLALTNQAAMTYGTQYIWFAFYDESVYVQFATVWDLNAHRPGGTLKLDYGYNQEPPSTGDFYNFFWPTLGQSVELVRTTGANGVTVITVLEDSMGNSGYPLVIFPTIGPVPPWLDFNVAAAFSVFIIEDYGARTDGYRYMTFVYPYSVGRSLFYGKAGNIQSDSSYDFATGFYGATYACLGQGSMAGWSSDSCYNQAVQIPSVRPAQNPAATDPYSPIVTGIQPFPPLPMDMGPDFGFCKVFGPAPACGDTITVSPTEVWTVLLRPTTADDTLCLLARTT